MGVALELQRGGLLPRQSWLEMIGPSAAAMVECLAGLGVVGLLGCWVSLLMEVFAAS